MQFRLPGVCLLLLIMQAARLRPRHLQSSLAFLVATPLLHQALSSSPSPGRCLSRGTKSNTPASTGVCKMTVATMEKAAITGPEWVLDYPSLDSPELLADLKEGTAAIARIEKISGPVKDAIADAANMSLTDAEPVLNVVQEMFDELWKSARLIGNIGVMVSCFGSVHGTDATAKKMGGQMAELRARRSTAYQPASLFLVLCSDEVAESFIARTEMTRSSGFTIRHARKMRKHKLSLAEESVATTLGVTGHSAWGMLYTDLSAAIEAKVEQKDGSTKTMSIASASALRDSPDDSVRAAGWRAVRDAWIPHAETCAATLNAITGWRQSMYDKRGYPSYLTTALHDNRMSAASLSALFDALDAHADTGKRALAIMASAMGKEKVDVWDFYAPAPKELAIDGDTEPKLYTFDEGIELIANSVAEVDEKAGDFVRMMRDKGFIEASSGGNKRPGAYMTEFPKSRTPRVYLSDYNGRSAMLVTLAHELGHAFHSWVMADMPLPETNYPMNLAETASIFFETVVGAALLKNARTTKERFSILWGEAQSAEAFLLNIPARFRFEEQLNIRRRDGKLSATEIDTLMVDCWKRYYGDSVQGLEKIGVFSQSKLHFYITGLSFYNFPYSFGYLFALGVYAEYEKTGDKNQFSKVYRDLLRDTGRMEAEKVVEKHLGSRIDDVKYWNSAIGIVTKKVDEFEALYKQIK